MRRPIPDCIDFTDEPSDRGTRSIPHSDWSPDEPSAYDDSDPVSKHSRSTQKSRHIKKGIFPYRYDGAIRRSGNLFCGFRDHLERMEELLQPRLQCSPDATSQSNLHVRRRECYLHGPGGSGKTRLALEFIKKFEEHFDIILWVNASDIDDSNLNAPDAFKDLAIRLGPDVRISLDEMSSADILMIVRPLLNDPLQSLGRPAKWLLVFDDVRNLESPKLREYTNFNSPSGCILMTGRAPLPASVKSSMALNGLDQDSGVEMLLSLVSKEPEADTRQLAKKILDQWDYLPVSILFVSSNIERRSHGKLEEFLTLSAEERHQALTTEFTFEAREWNLAALWSITSLSPGPANLMHRLAFFDPNSIPDQFLRATFPDWNDAFYDTDLKDLESQCLLQQSGPSDRKAITMLTIIHDTVLAHVLADTQQAERSFNYAAKTLLRLRTGDPDNDILAEERSFEDASSVAMLLPHVLHLTKVHKEVFKENSPCTQKSWLTLLLESAW